MIISNDNDSLIFDMHIMMKMIPRYYHSIITQISIKYPNIKSQTNNILSRYFDKPQYCTLVTPFQYKLGLIKTLIDRAYKINNTTQGFQNDINTLTTILKRNMFPSWLIDKSVQGYLRNVTTKEAPKHDVSIFTNYLTSVSIDLIPERKCHLLSTSIARI